MYNRFVIVLVIESIRRRKMLMYELEIITRRCSKKIVNPYLIQAANWFFDKTVITIADIEGNLHYIGYCTSERKAGIAMAKMQAAIHIRLKAIKIKELY